MVSQGPSKVLHVCFTIKHSLLPWRRETHKYKHKMPQTRAEWPHSGCDYCSPAAVSVPTAGATHRTARCAPLAVRSSAGRLTTSRPPRRGSLE